MGRLLIKSIAGEWSPWHVVEILLLLIFCRKFVHCAPGIEVVADCPSGLLYNEAIKVCDYPRQANCVEFKASDDTKLVIAENLIEW